MIERTLTLVTVIIALVLPHKSQAQSFNQIDEEGNITKGGQNASRNFNPHNNDTTKNKEIPKGLHVWTIDRRFGDLAKAEIDTMPHLFPHTRVATGTHGEFNTTGNNFSARQNRIFVDREATQQFIFTQPYDYVYTQPDQWHFTNTLSPLTNISYDNCGDKNNGEDHFDAKFAVNAGKRLGLGFDINYAYARGFFQNQNLSHFSGTLYGSYLGDAYQAHLLFSTHHEKTTENGGISNDDYILHPELFSESFAENEIPTILERNWNRNHHRHVFLTHRYSLGFYRRVPMTEEEIRARQFAEQSRQDQLTKQGQQAGNSQRSLAQNSNNQAPHGRPEGALIAGAEPQQNTSDTTIVDTTRINVSSKEMQDSILAAQAKQDSIEATTKRVFVPVTSFIHTLELNNHQRRYQAYESPSGYYAYTFFDQNPAYAFGGDSIQDATKHTQIKNTLALALLEGFNKYAQSGLKAFVSYDLRTYELPSLDGNGMAYYEKTTEHSVSIGGNMQRTQGSTWHYNLTAETWLAGEDAGQLRVDLQTDLNFPCLGDTAKILIGAWFHRDNPTFYQRRYHSKHFWWDASLKKESRSHIEGRLLLGKTNTCLRIAIEEIQNYTYFSMAYDREGEYVTNMTANIAQHSGNINVLTAQLDQKLKLGPLHWDNIVTYQSSSEKDVLPLPKINLFSNLYLTFRIAKVLTVELGGSLTYFSKYHAPDFCPAINQFAIQQTPDSRVELGGFPFVDAYANLHLKHTRFFIMMTDALGDSGNRMRYLVPHYPQNGSTLRMGVSWNFFN